MRINLGTFVRVNEKERRNCYLVDLERSARKSFSINLRKGNFTQWRRHGFLIESQKVFSCVCVILNSYQIIISLVNSQ
jgi:hypothetical protein